MPEPQPLRACAAGVPRGKAVRRAGHNGQEQEFRRPETDVPDAILGNRTYFPDGDFFHEFEYFDPARNMSLGGRTWIFTVELAKLDEIARKPVDKIGNAERWAVFFEYLTDPEMRAKINEIAAREEGIKMAGGVLLNISRNEVERARLESEYKAKIDMQARLVDAKREGRQEASV